MQRVGERRGPMFESYRVDERRARGAAFVQGSDASVWTACKKRVFFGHRGRFISHHYETTYPEIFAPTAHTCYIVP